MAALYFVFEVIVAASGSYVVKGLWLASSLFQLKVRLERLLFIICI